MSMHHNRPPQIMQHTPQQQHQNQQQNQQSPVRPSDNNEDSARKKQKTLYSCAECRRTKAKCDRSWPCSECKRKGFVHLCPNHVSTTALPKTKTIALLTERVKDLEDRLRRLGQDVDTPVQDGVSSDSGGPSRRESEVEQHGSTQPYDMTAMLGKLALGPGITSSKRYAGTEAAPFYLDSPPDSGDESESRKREPIKLGGLNLDNPVPWAHTVPKGSTAWGEMPGSLIDQCRELLPTQRDAKTFWSLFWELTSWRIQPMSSSYFHSRILPAIYRTNASPRPDQVAVLLSLIGLTVTLDPSTQLAKNLPASARTYVDTSWTCLVAGRLFTDTTLEALITLSIMGACLLNADDKRSPDGNFAIFGLAMRLCIIAGYHRDPALIQPDMPLEEMDARRRIWHELLGSDRLHSMPALLPNSIDINHYDTRLPSDMDLKGYYMWKWTVGVQISRVVDYWTSVRIPPYSALLDIDTSIRRLYARLPNNLRCAELPPTAFAVRDGTTSSQAPMDLASSPFAPQDTVPIDALPDGATVRQRIRLAMHFCMLFFYLHRPCFIRALVASDSTMELSILTMVETCQHVVTLTSSVMSLDWTLSRWFSFSADLFSILHCLTVLIVKTPGRPSASYMALLEKGVETLGWTCSARPNTKNRALLRGGERLLKNAKSVRSEPSPSSSVTGAANMMPPSSLTPYWQDWLVNGGAALAGMPTAALGMDPGNMGIGQENIPQYNGGDDMSIDAFISGLYQSSQPMNIPPAMPQGIPSVPHMFNT